VYAHVFHHLGECVLSTKHVVLGLLVEQRGYGYELQQRIDRRFEFLGLSESTVYGLLTRLERDGLIEERGPKETGRTKRGAPRVIYGATEAGVAEFGRWMAAPCDAAIPREELHAKIVLSDPEDLPQLIAMAERQERECLAQLQQLTSRGLHELVDDGLAWRDVAAMLVEDAQAARMQATLDWLQRARAVMERRLAAAALARARGR
jgi:DNA-binding PadR family transcriptional regulator